MHPGAIGKEAVISLGILLNASEYIIADDGRVAAIGKDGMARWVGFELDELIESRLIECPGDTIHIADNARYWFEKLVKQRKYNVDN